MRRRSSVAGSSRTKGAGTEVLSAELYPLLHRISRLRVMTASQAHKLFDPFVKKTERAVRARLKGLEEAGFLKVDLVDPSRGAVAKHFYRLAYRGLRELNRDPTTHTLERPSDTNLLKRPSQFVLEYLLFRNEVYARARSEGWHIGSPVFTPSADQGRYLALFRHWALGAAQAEVETVSARLHGAADAIRARQFLERLPRFLPSALTFEFLVRINSKREPKELVLLVMDDPRRSVESQIGQLPGALPGLRLILRDTESRFDVAQDRLVATSRRLRRWQRLLVDRYGSEILKTDTLFPELWARVVPRPVPVVPTPESTT